MLEQDVRDHLIDSLTTLFSKSGGNIQDFNLPRRSTSSESSSTNRFIEEELAYDIDNLLDESETFLRKLNAAQRHAFNVIVNTVLNEEHGFYFVSGYGGTGKTFLWNAIITHLRSQRKIVLSVASSGVASLLLPGGCTTHSRFKIPCDDLDDSTTCNIRRGTMLAELIRLASLIIWDEAFMTHIIAFEALDRTLHDLLSLQSPEARKLPFGGKVVVLGGDPRQILPIVENGNRSQIVDAAITNSSLWSHVTILHLTANMRLSSPMLTEEARDELTQFSKWVLDIGEGNIPARAKDGEIEPTWIKIPHELLMPRQDSIQCMMNSAYPNLCGNYTDMEYLNKRAILIPTNDAVDTINDYVVSIIPGDAKEYLSCDKISKTPDTHDS
jgi:hypothetical protein